MYHRYGRHGPEAWRRRRQRQLQRHLPIVVVPTGPVPTVTGPAVAIVRVQVPISTERIIFIIMSDGEKTSQESYEVPTDGNQMGKFPLVPSQIAFPEKLKQDQNTLPLSIMKVLQRAAERRALKDSQRIGDYAEDELDITIDSKQFERRIQDLAEEDISNDLLRDDAVSGYEALFNVYAETYRAQFKALTQPYAKWMSTVRGQKEQQLRKLLSQDRQDVKTRSRGDWHARDLVVLRLLQVYYSGQVEQIGVTALLTHHELIDRYERFVLNTDTRNEVIWPEDTFRL